MIKKLKYTFLLTSLLFFTSCTEQTPQEKWVSLDGKTDELNDDGYSSKSVKKAMETLEFAEKNFGPDHENSIVSRNKLAKLFSSSLRYLEAGNLYMRSYKTEKSKVGANNYRLVFYYRKLGRVFALQHRFKKA